MDMIQLAGLVAAQQEKQAMEAMLLQGFQVGYPAQPIFFNPLIARGSPATISAPPQAANKPPQTSLFVGNISEKCTNEFIQQMLEECGKVSNWKRIKGSNGKFQQFGFCDFEEPESTLRALRVLHDFQIGDKKLNLKADDKVRAHLIEFWQKKRTAEGKSPQKLAPDELPADEEALKVDEEVRLKILNVIEKDHPDLLIIAEDGEVSDKEKEKKKKDDSKRRDRDDKKSSRRRSRSRSRSARRRRSRSPKHKRRRRHSSSSGHSGSSRSRSRSRSSSRSSEEREERKDDRSRDERRKDDRRRSRSRSGHDSEDSDEARERRALKKQLKEKEQAYVSRLKKWESRERRMARMYEKEETKEQQRRRDVQKEAKKLRHFLEDYDDERDDIKYYKSSSLFQRRREYEKEKEQDALDRKREQQEIEELKKQIMADGKDAAEAEEEAKKRHKIQEEEALRKLREDSGSPNPHKPLGAKEEESSESESGSSESSDEEEKVDDGEEKANGSGTPSTPVQQESKWKVATAASESSPTGVIIASSSSPVLKSTNSRPDLSQRLNGVFGMEDEEEESGRKKMKPFQITQEERMQALTPEERKKMMKQLIDKIPTSKDALFSYKIDWSYVDNKLIETRVRPWVTNKIQQYIGEDERSLVDFVCEKVQSRTQPDRLLTDMTMILDDEAETFVVKMWRLLIYESESRKAGLVTEKRA